MNWCAFVDESEPDPRADPGAYLLAAALLATSQLEPARQQVSRLRLRGQRRLHWRDENHDRRKQLTAAVAELPALHLVVVRVDQNASSARRRRQCLRRLLCELDTAGVTQVQLEAREPKQNARDRHLLEVLRASRAIHTPIRLDHYPGPREPLLWVPDVVAGAVGAARRGQPNHQSHLGGVLTIHQA